MNADAELTSLLRACMLEPDSREPRQVAGDWLEENGQSAAETALASLLRQPGPEFRLPQWWAAISDAERPVSEQHKVAWLGRMANNRNWGLDRGLFTLRCEAAALLDGSLPLPSLRGGKSWFARLSVERIQASQFTRLRECPWLDGFTGFLDLRSGPTGLATWLDSPTWSGLTGLGFEHGADAELLPALCGMSHWRNIIALSLSGTGQSAEGMQNLADAPIGQALRILHAERNHMSDAGLTALAQSGSRETLRGLEWDYNNSGDAGAAALATMPNLRHLSLARNRGLSLDGLGTLLGAAFAPRLQHLSLAFLDLGDPMCRLLARAGTLRSLTRLDVSGDATMTRAGIRSLVESDKLPSLEWLGVPTRLKSGGVPCRDGLHIA